MSGRQVLTVILYFDVTVLCINCNFVWLEGLLPTQVVTVHFSVIPCINFCICCLWYCFLLLLRLEVDVAFGAKSKH